MAQSQRNSAQSLDQVRLSPAQQSLLWRKAPAQESRQENELGDTTLLLDQDDTRLPVCTKLAYAVGAIPYAMCNTVAGFYLSIFLLEVVILDTTFVLLIVFLGRVFDAVTDPIVGYLCTRTRTRFGRLRPWMISGALSGGVVYALLWFVPPGIDDVDQSNVVKFVYYLFFYLAFQALLTCIHVPYTSLTMHLSHNNRDRDSATLYRMCFEVLGTILGILIYTAYFVGFVGDSSEQRCEGGEREPDENQRRAYGYHAVTLGVIVIVCTTITFLGVREQKDEIHKDKSIGLCQVLREILGFKPYRILFLAFLFAWLAAQFIQGNYALYVKYTVGLEKQYPYVISVLLVATILCMPLWQLVILKLGKKMALTLGLWMSVPSILGLLYADFYPYSIYILAAAGGVGLSAGFLVPWSMLPDVIDAASVQMKIRREEMFYAFFVFGSKFGSGVTIAISTGIYEIAGYDEDKCDQPWTVPLTLKLLVTIPPVLFIVLSLFFIHLYPITEQSRERTKLILQERRRESVYQASAMDVDQLARQSNDPEGKQQTKF